MFLLLSDPDVLSQRPKCMHYRSIKPENLGAGRGSQSYRFLVLRFAVDSRGFV